MLCQEQGSVRELRKKRAPWLKYQEESYVLAVLPRTAKESPSCHTTVPHTSPPQHPIELEI